MLNPGVRLCLRIATTDLPGASAWPIRWLRSFRSFHSGRGLVAAPTATPAESVRRWAYLTDVEGNLNFFQGAVRQSDALTYDAYLCEPYAPAGHRSCGHFCMSYCFQCHLPSHASTSTHSAQNALANTHIHRHTNSSIYRTYTGTSRTHIIANTTTSPPPFPLHRPSFHWCLVICSNRLQLQPDCSLVFGGDCFDKGPGDIRVSTALVDLKRRHPDRVFLLLGGSALVLLV